MARSVLVSALVMLAAGCGYRAGYTARNDVRTVAVPVFANDTFYRDIELEATRAVVSQVEKSTPYRLVDSGAADAVLRGRITGYGKAVLQENAADEATDTEIVLTVRVTLEDARTGKALAGGSIRERETFSGPLGETEEGARAALFRRTARRIVETAFERDW